MKKILLKITIAAVFLLSIALSSSAQVKKGEFLYSSATDSYMGYCVIHTSDGGYAMCGTSINTSLISYVVYVTKMDVNGAVQWSNIYYVTNGAVSNSMIQTYDGGYAITGAAELSHGGNDNIYVLKISSTGALQWTNIIEAVSANNSDGGNAIIQTKDTGYAICGTDAQPSVNSMYVLKLNSSGTLKWTRSMTGAYDTYGNAITLAKNGDIIGFGTTYNYGKGKINMYLAEFDNSGKLIKTRTIGGKRVEEGDGISPTKDGGFIACGSSTSFGADTTNGDLYVVKLDSTLNIQWGKTIGGSHFDYGSSVVQTLDGGYEATGSTYTYHDTTFGDVYVVKLDASGNLKWTGTSHPSTVDEYGASIAAYNSNGGGIIVGQSLSCQFCLNSVFMIITDSTGLCSSGPTGGSVSSGGLIDSGGTATTIALSTTAGGILDNTGPAKGVICKPAGLDNPAEEQANTVLIYPNPVADNLSIDMSNLSSPATDIKVLDVAGRQLLSQKINGVNNDIIQMNISSLSTGMYFITIMGDHISQTYKFIKD